MQKAIILVLDSLGIGKTNNSNQLEDYGANTLGHIAEYCYNKYNKNKIYKNLKIPNLTKLGLAKAAKKSSGKFPKGLNKKEKIIGSYSFASIISSGKDTISGHWEMAGSPVLFNWDYFLSKKNSFPEELLNKIIKKTNLLGFLGNCHASGTDIINQLGEIHIKNKFPIFYTSVDSVFQIACHEDFFGLNNLYKLSSKIRKILIDYNYNISRVIARPFIGIKNGKFVRTNNRRDFALPTTNTTILEKLIIEKSGKVISIGKIADIFAHKGISKIVQANGLNELFNATISEINKLTNNSLLFVNFVDFDSIYGHRRDVNGYIEAIEYFDKRLPEIISLIKENDILIITADHGCDPTWVGNNHTRENVPIIIYSSLFKPGFYGHRNTLSDIAQTLANYFNLSNMKYGTLIK